MQIIFDIFVGVLIAGGALIALVVLWFAYMQATGQNPFL